MKLGNLIISGIVTGSIYAAFAACVALWYRVCNILNLAVGDFAMLGALGVDDLVRVHHWKLAPAIAAMLRRRRRRPTCMTGSCSDWRRTGAPAHEGIVVTFFFTFALSFFIEGIAELLYGTDVHAAPAVWSGESLSLGGGLHVDRAGVLVVAFAAIVGIASALVLRGTLQGKAIEACGENFFGARIVGIDNRKYRRLLFILSAALACVFGILESPITGYTYDSGAATQPHRIHRRRLRRIPEARQGGRRRPRHRHPGGAARRLRVRQLRRHDPVRVARRSSPHPAERNGPRHRSRVAHDHDPRHHHERPPPARRRPRSARCRPRSC